MHTAKGRAACSAEARYSAPAAARRPSWPARPAAAHRSQRERRATASAEPRRRTARAIPAEQRLESEPLDDIGEDSVRRRSSDIAHAQAILEVLADGAAKENGPLLHQCHAPAQRCGGAAGNHRAVEEHLPFGRCLEEREEAQQRALSRAVVSDDCRRPVSDGELLEVEHHAAS